MSDVVQRSVDASAVTDVLINELVRDTAAELHRQQNDNIVDRQSAFLRDTPSVESLLHRLLVIEVMPSVLFISFCFVFCLFVLFFVYFSPVTQGLTPEITA